MYPVKAIKFYERGLDYQERGMVRDAVRQYRKAVELCDEFIEAINNLANLYLECGRTGEAVASFRKALELSPGHPMLMNNLGNALQSHGKTAEAEGVLRQLVEALPEYADAWSNFGNVQRSLGRPDDAADAYGCALKIAPDNASVYCNRGDLRIEQHQYSDAVEDFRQALQLHAGHGKALLGLGKALRMSGSHESAITAYQQAAQCMPSNSDVYVGLGNTYMEMTLFDAAQQAYSGAIELDPADSVAYIGMGNVRMEQDNYTGALRAYRKALKLDSDAPAVHEGLANAYLNLGRHDRAAESYLHAISIRPEHSTISNYLLALHYDPESTQATIFAETTRLVQSAWAPGPGTVPSGHGVHPEGKIRVGYVSADFRQHSVAYFLAPLLAGHDGSRVEIFCYYNNDADDEMTALIRQHCDHWRVIYKTPGREAAETIRSDRIDILVDLAGHTRGNRLDVFALKPAPVQVTWLGYPDTTGVGHIGYRITDAVADPVGEADSLHSERLVRLADGFLCYGMQGPGAGLAVSAAPCVAAGYVTFGCFNNVNKLNSRVIAAWSGILKQLPDARLVLKARQLADESVRGHYLGLFTSAGIDAGRIDLLPQLPSATDHMKAYNNVDIALDPFPYNGTTTTMEALWMGVPVIALSGTRHSGRVGSSILGHAGLAGFLADDIESYVRLAVALANDRARLVQARGELRERLVSASICDNARFARNMEDAYQSMLDDNRAGRP